MAVTLLGCLLLAIVVQSAHLPSEWQGRKVYQVLTDRFSTDNNTQAPPCDVTTYCGGTFAGLTKQLPYIKSMGFDALWISPIVANTPGGYHGYWAKDFFSINPHFGTVTTLQQLVATAHTMGIWIMVDIVVNHVGPVGDDFSTIVPFNQAGHYHTDCQVTQYVCMTDQVLRCRLADLPDLNQSVPYVQQQLTAAVQWALKTFDFDGIRADTVMYIEPSYWSNLINNLGNPYIVGEVWSDYSCIKLYTDQSIVAAINYPLFYTILSVFQGRQSMRQLGSVWRQQLTYRNPDLMLNFIDNHDNDRFLDHADIGNTMAAYAHATMTNGIPAMYYGTEQYFKGQNADQTNREPMWPSKYATTDFVKFLGRLNAFYDAYNISHQQVAERWQDDTMYCFLRGSVMLLCTTNTGAVQQRTIPNLPFAGKNVCEWFTGACTSGSSTMQIAIPSGKSLGLFYAK